MVPRLVSAPALPHLVVRRAVQVQDLDSELGERYRCPRREQYGTDRGKTTWGDECNKEGEEKLT